MVCSWKQDSREHGWLHKTRGEMKCETWNIHLNFKVRSSVNFHSVLSLIKTNTCGFVRLFWLNANWFEQSASFGIISKTAIAVSRNSHRRKEESLGFGDEKKMKLSQKSRFRLTEFSGATAKTKQCFYSDSQLVSSYLTRLCSSRAQLPLATSVRLWATRKYWFSRQTYCICCVPWNSRIEVVGSQLLFLEHSLSWAH